MSASSIGSFASGAAAFSGFFWSGLALRPSIFFGLCVLIGLLTISAIIEENRNR